MTNPTPARTWLGFVFPKIQTCEWCRHDTYGIYAGDRVPAPDVVPHPYHLECWIAMQERMNGRPPSLFRETNPDC